MFDNPDRVLAMIIFVVVYIATAFLILVTFVAVLLKLASIGIAKRELEEKERLQKSQETTPPRDVPE